MAAIFPSTPYVGDTVTIENIKYRWTGTTWIIVPGAVQNAVVQSNNGAIDLSKGSYHKILIDAGNAAVTVSFSNVPSGSSKWSLELDVDVAYTVTWPASIIWTENTPPTTMGDRTMILEFYTPNGGTTIYGVESINNGPDPAWDLSYAKLDPSVVSDEWNVTTARYLRNFSVAAQETNPGGMFFRDDGLKMYIVGTVNDNVNEYDLGTAWDVSTASFLQLFSIRSQEGLPQALFFKPDGLKMYVMGTAGDDVNEYNLSTAWDVSTASFLQLFSVAAQESVPTGLFFKPDGLKMYVVGTTGDDVNEYNLSTAWDVTTASFVQLFSVSAQDVVPRDVFFRADGLKMYIAGGAGDDINEYDLSTAWDVTTASFVQLFSVLANSETPTSVFFRPDGRKMYVLSSSSDDVNEYDVSKVGRSFSVAAQETNPSEVFFKPDGLKMYIVGITGDDVNEYHLATAWDVTTASFVQLFSVAAQETSPRGMFFKPDGLKMFIVGTSGDDVNEYDLSTAWDVSTASFLQLFSVAAQEINPSAVFFRDDGLKMYVMGITGDDVNEYDLSTAWDVSTASFLHLFSVSAQETFPRGLFFKPDGLRMYVAGQTGDDINEYHLATAWDVTTASFVQLFSVAAQDTTPMGLFFRDDGLRMYVAGTSSAIVFEYIFTS